MFLSDKGPKAQNVRLYILSVSAIHQPFHIILNITFSYYLFHITFFILPFHVMQRTMFLTTSATDVLIKT